MVLPKFALEGGGVVRDGSEDHRVSVIRDRDKAVEPSPVGECMVEACCIIKEIDTHALPNSDGDGYRDTVIGSGPPDYTSE